MISALWSTEHTHTTPRWKPLKPSTVGNGGGKWLNIASPFEPLATLVERVTTLSHCRNSLLHLLCTCVNHCTKAKCQVPLLGIRSVTMARGTECCDGTAWEPAVALKHSTDVQTHCVCHDVLWMRFRSFMGKGFVLDDIWWLRGWKKIAV